MSVQPAFTKRSLYYGWLPQSLEVHREFLKNHVLSAHDKRHVPHKPAVAAFEKTICSSPVMTHLFDSIFHQINKDPKWESSDPKYRVRDFGHLLSVLDTIIDAPPRFYKVANEQGEIISDAVGVPMGLVIDLLGNTSAGHDLFRMPEFNVAMKKLLDAWANYLNSDGSNATLNTGPDGWYSAAGMVMLTSGLGGLTFDQTYVVDRGAGVARYKSWDKFFTRALQSGVRPIVGPGVLPVIYNPCESTILRTATNVQLHDTFWLKTQNYSLFDMFGGTAHPGLSKRAGEFVGGSVYQAYLAPFDFHRWHSPVKGNVTASVTIDGTYFAVLPDEGAPPYDPDIQPGDPHGAMMRCLPWLSVAATRAVLIIEPTDPNLHIKRVCFIAIGMVEVSTCQRTVEGTREKPTPVEAGQEIGMFHFGGSSYVMIIKPEEGYEVLFQDINSSPIRPGQHRWINSIVGYIQPVKKPKKVE